MPLSPGSQDVRSLINQSQCLKWTLDVKTNSQAFHCCFITVDLYNQHV